MAAHLVSTGAHLQPDDIPGTGTMAGARGVSLGYLLEIMRAGKNPMALADSSKRV